MAARSRLCSADHLAHQGRGLPPEALLSDSSPPAAGAALPPSGSGATGAARAGAAAGAAGGGVGQATVRGAGRGGRAPQPRPRSVSIRATMSAPPPSAPPAPASPPARRRRGRNLGIHLVGGDFEDRFVPLDGVTDLLEPPGHRALGDRLAHLGHDDVDACHPSSPRTAGLVRRQPAARLHHVRRLRAARSLRAVGA